MHKNTAVNVNFVQPSEGGEDFSATGHKHKLGIKKK